LWSSVPSGTRDDVFLGDHEDEWSVEMAVVPFEDRPDRERRRFPIVVLALLILNILVFLYQLTLPREALEAFVRAWGAVPAEITTGQDLPPTIPLPVHLTLVTSMFIHGGFAHIFINMLFLWVFGDNVEDALGHGTFLVFYLVAGILAGLANAVLLADSPIPGIGASGAVAGVLAGYLILFPRAEVRTLLAFGPFITVGRIAALLLIGIWFILQLGQGVASLGVAAQEGGVAYFAHVGGFLAGLVMILAIRAVRGQRIGNPAEGLWIGRVFGNWLIAVVVLALLFGGTLLLAAAGEQVLATILQGLIVLGAVIVALVDAGRRIIGQPSFLGSGTGSGRLLALLQLFLVLSLLVGFVLMVL
jgi:membrane associated rhomboid family serine protease